MRFRVRIEHQPSVGPYRSFVPLVDAVLANRLQDGVGTAAKVLSPGDHGGLVQPILVEYELGGEGRFASHEQVVDFFSGIMQDAGLYAVRAVISEVVRHYVAGAILSGATAFGITKDMSPWVAMMATVVAASMGALAGGRIELEVARLEAQRHPYGRWSWWQPEQVTIAGPFAARA